MADLLLIDDEETLLATLQLELQRAGHHVVAVNNATEGLQALESFEPSVALVDIKLPDIDGVEVIERVRALGYDFPIIVMTAYGSVGGAVEAMTAAIPFTERVIHETHVLTDSSPLSVYRTLYGDECNTFLYESLQTDGTRGRYSFLGGRPLAIAEVNDGGVLITQNGESRADPRHPNDVFRDLLQTLPQLPSIEPLAGGLVGFFAYDYVNRLETLPSNNPDELQIPDARFMGLPLAGGLTKALLLWKRGWQTD